MTPLEWLYVLALWVLFAWLYHDYRLDRFRFELFQLRHRLFLQAASGPLSFDLPAYKMLRQMINGNLRIGHRFGLLTIVLVWFVVRRNGGATGPQAAWQAALDSLSDEQRRLISASHSQMHSIVCEQLCATSLLLWLTVVPIIAVFILLRFPVQLASWGKSIIGASAVHRIVSRFDAYAMLVSAEQFGRLAAEKLKRITDAHAPSRTVGA